MVDKLLDENLTEDPTEEDPTEEDPTPVDPPAPEPTPPYDSILLTIRKKIGGYVEGDTAFDEDLITNINTALSILTQIGVGPADGFFITGDQETWADLLGPHSKPAKLQMVKDFVFLQTKMIFDPPQIGGVINAYQAQLDMLTWRLNVAVDPGE